MESIWASTSEVLDSYLNISLIFLLRRCHQISHPTLEDSESQDANDENTADLSSYLNEAIDWLFGGADKAAADHGIESFWEERGDCQDLIHSSFGGSVSVISLVKAFFGVLLCLCVTLTVLCRVWNKVTWGCKKDLADTALKRKETFAKEEQVQENQKEVDTKTVGAVHEEQQKSDVTKETDHKGPVLKGHQPNLPVIISLASASRTFHNLTPLNLVARPDSVQFLTVTVDHLQAQLDWVLGLTAADQLSPTNEPMSSATASLVTPRLQRKGSFRRPRWRTLVSLPLGASNMSPDDKLVVRTWQKVEEMERRMNWKQLDVGELDINVVQDNHLSAVLQFYEQTCPVRAEQWGASCLIVNYILTLLEHELLFASSERHPLRILELRSFGSAANETCISRADRFDVMLVVQVPSCSEMTVYHCGVCDDIPAGKLVLGVKEPSSSTGRTSSQQLLQKDRVGDLFGMFLSQKEVVKTAQRLVSDALDRLKLKNKLLLDRLPFSLHLSQYDDLLICVETKMLNGLGLGLSKITVRLTPSVRVSSQESDPLPAVYAVPLWNSCASENSGAARGRIQSRIMRNHYQGIPRDLLWQLNCSELTSLFMSLADRRLFSAGVSGCQVMCQQILRALFSPSGKDILLTMGEVHPHVLDSVVCFLLLESPPSSWNLACLPDRLSDCVHFLRSAVQSAWMPGFMVHNPHLMKQMPALQLLPLLTTSRQENILANLGPDDIDTILSFLDSRLQETGLQQCLKADYSTEMWEYEFFIFG